jgi:hypothetical protein
LPQNRRHRKPSCINHAMAAAHLQCPEHVKAPPALPFTACNKGTHRSSLGLAKLWTPNVLPQFQFVLCRKV